MINNLFSISDTEHTGLVKVMDKHQKNCVSNTVLMSELLSNFWTYLKEQDPGLYLTKFTQGLMEYKTWVKKRMTPQDSVFTGEIVVTVARLHSVGEYSMIYHSMIYHEHFQYFGTVTQSR